MNATAFTRFDAADYLDSEADIAAYLQAVIDDSDGDPAAITHALGTIARARNMSQLARDTGLTREGLRKALSGDGNPTFSTVHKVARALGLQLAFLPLAGTAAAAAPDEATDPTPVTPASTDVADAATTTAEPQHTSRRP